MLRLIFIIRNFWNKSISQQSLLIEAAICLVLARVALAVVPFRHLTKYMGRTLMHPEVMGSDRERLRNEVAWAVTAAAKHLPIKMVCFPRGIAAQAMLRRRLIGATIFYGVANLPEHGLAAHVWVQDGTCGVVGHQVAAQYAVLMCYPSYSDSLILE